MMTDIKIEKGLACCCADDYECEYCPYKYKCVTKQIVNELCKDALAYINRLKAEKAVSDRALVIAVCDIKDLTKEYITVPQNELQQFIYMGVETYKKQAKQELEKEKANAKNKG